MTPPDRAPEPLSAVREWVAAHVMRLDKYPTGTTVVDAEELDAFLATLDAARDSRPVGEGPHTGGNVCIECGGGECCGGFCGLHQAGPAAVRPIERELDGKRVRADVCPVCAGTVLAPESLRRHVRDVHPEAILPNGETVNEAIARLDAERASDPWRAGWNASARWADGAVRESAEALVIAFRRYCVDRYGEPPSEEDLRGILEVAGRLSTTQPASTEAEPS